MASSSQSGRSPHGGGSQQPVRKSVWVLVGGTFVVAAVGLGWWATRSSDPPSSAATTSAPPVVAQAPEPAAPLPPVPPPEMVAPLVSREPAPSTAPSGDLTRVERAAPATASSRPEPSAYTRQLVGSLTQIDLSQGALSPEQAAQWKQNLQTLLQQGPAAVPAIQEFLEKNVDLNLAAVAGGNQIGSPSVREAMFDALNQIGGPEAIGAMAQTLASTADPREIALLARNLEHQAPGEFRDAALNAARDVLNQAGSKNLGNLDVGPLFELMVKYGGADVVGDLENASSKWSYYSLMALSQLPEQAGVPALINMVDRSGDRPPPNSQMLASLLAQSSGTSPDAAAALEKMVSQNKVPATAWPMVAKVLGGGQIQFGSGVMDGQTPPTGSDLQTFHISFGNQRYWSSSHLQALDSGQIQQRIQLIDRMLGMTTHPFAVSNLKQSRAILEGAGR